MSTDVVRNNLDARNVETGGEYAIRIATVFDSAISDAMANHIGEGETSAEELQRAAGMWVYIGKIAEQLQFALGQYMEMPRDASIRTQESSDRIHNRLTSIRKADSECRSAYEAFVEYLDKTQMQRAPRDNPEKPPLGFKRD